MKNKYTIHHPHDKALFKALENHEIARDAMRAYFPSSLLALTELDNIQLYKTKFITPEFKAFEADIIYEVQLTDQSALILFHCEQQSTVDKYISLRIWQYLLLLLMEYAENHPERALPLVFPLILYTGESPYDESTDFFDLFGTHKALAQEYLLNSIKLIDVCRMPDEDIKKHRLFGLSEYVFKHKKTQHFEKVLQELLCWIGSIEYEVGKNYVKMLVRYVSDVYPEADYEIFAEGIKCYLSKELGDETMTISEQLEQRGMRKGIQQGMQQGMQQGVQQGKHVIARSMLADKMPIETICKYTALSVAEIRELEKELGSTKH